MLFLTMLMLKGVSFSPWEKVTPDAEKHNETFHLSTEAFLFKIIFVYGATSAL